MTSPFSVSARRRRAARRGAVAVVGALNVASGVAGSVDSAQAAAGCTDGSRPQAAAIAARGGFLEPRRTGWFDGKAYFSVTLRYDPQTRCVWGLLNANPTNRPASHLWIDRSTDRGRTWQGLLGYQTLAGAGWASGANYSTYTGVFNDGGSTARACGKSDRLGATFCTGWY